MQRNIIEIVMGAVVLLGASFFSFMVYQTAGMSTADGYAIDAEFGTTGGLTVGDDVRLSGIKIGRIVGQSLNPQTFTARIEMRINDDIQLPADTSARITAASLLGVNFLELIPGADDAILEAGTTIYDTSDPVSLTDLLGKVVFQGSGGGGN